MFLLKYLTYILLFLLQDATNNAYYIMYFKKVDCHYVNLIMGTNVGVIYTNNDFNMYS